MTRNECMEILGNKEHPMYKELHYTYYVNHNKAKAYFKELGYDSSYVLHHIKIDCDNYEDWNVEELIPMTKKEHSYLHQVIYKQGWGSPESQKKAHDTLRAKYKSGELTVWNKGLTADVDIRVASPRKGKTGKDYPFLCASKIGKSGGWNRGLTKETDERVAKYIASRIGNGNPKIAGDNNPSKRPEVKQKISESKKGKKQYSNGIEVHRYIPGQEPEGYLPSYYFSKKYRDKIKNESD